MKRTTELRIAKGPAYRWDHCEGWYRHGDRIEIQQAWMDGRKKIWKPLKVAKVKFSPPDERYVKGNV